MCCSTCSFEVAAMQGIRTEGKRSVYLKMGDSMAQFSAQPRLMTSVAFRVRLGSFLKKSFRMLMMAGTLEEPPVTSTEAMSSRLIFASSSAYKQKVRKAKHSEQEVDHALSWPPPVGVFDKASPAGALIALPGALHRCLLRMILADVLESLLNSHG